MPNKQLNKLKLAARRRLGQQIVKIKPDKSNAKYISWHTALDILDSVFDRVDIEFPEHWKEDCSPKKPKTDNNSQGTPTLEEQNPVVFVKCRITVTYTDDTTGKEYKIIKESFGSATVIGGQKEQQSHYKAASSDALKKTLVLFGIGRELYRTPDEQKYCDDVINNDFSYFGLLWKYKASYQNINNIMIAHNLTYEILNSLIFAWSNGKHSQLNTDNVDEFSKWLSELYPTTSQQQQQQQQNVQQQAQVQATNLVPDLSLPNINIDNIPLRN